MSKFFEMLGKIDRRIIYVLLLLAIGFPLVFPLNLPLQVSVNSQAIYDKIESLPDTAAILLCFDFDPTSIPECQPMAIALAYHIMKRGNPLFVYTNYPETGPIADRILEPIGKQFNRVYGKDYVNLGYKSGNNVLLMSLGNSWIGPFPTDQRGNNTTDMPIIKNFPNYRKLSFMVDIAHGSTVDYFVSVGVAQFAVPMGVGTTAVSIPAYKAYIQSGQIVGMLGGLKGAAEYEKLVGVKGKATSGMDAQSVAHVLIIGLILIGNLSLLWSKIKRRGGKA